MMKTRFALMTIVAWLASTLSLLPAGSAVNVMGPRAGLPLTNDEFGLCNPLDWKSVERGWRYVIRYGQYDSESGLSFSLMLVRAQQPDRFVLALHEGKPLTFAQFDEATEEEKIRLAVSSKEIDQALAQALYEAWVNALLRARFGSGVGRSTGADFYYVSAFAMDAGYMCANSDGFEPGKTTGKIRELGLLLRSYLKASSPEAERKIEEKMLRLGAEVRRE